jgi:hypothetical protein
MLVLDILQLLHVLLEVLALGCALLVAVVRVVVHVQILLTLIGFVELALLVSATRTIKSARLLNLQPAQ